MDCALGGCSLQPSFKIYIPKTRYKTLPHKQGSLGSGNMAPVTLENNKSNKIHAFKKMLVTINLGQAPYQPQRMQR